MSETVDIGAARVRLIVDAADFEPIIAQGQRAITGFGQVAQQAYDRTEKGTRRAADALLDYVNSLGRADTTMDRYLRTASRMGVEKPVLDAAITAWARHNDEVEQANTALEEQAQRVQQAQAAYKELISVQAQSDAAEKARANAAAKERFDNLAQARAATAQQGFNSVLGVSTPTIDFDKRNAAEEVFAGIVARENAALEEQTQLIAQIAAGRAQQTATNAQQDFNRLLGIPEQEEALALIQRRKDAEAAFLPILEEESKLERENSQLVSKQQAFLQTLENTAKTAGKTYYEMLQLRAAEAGVSAEAAPMIAKIRAQNEAMGAGTISAKQYEFALRGLPAQFTDIVVSLQGGQRPLTVLLQQGGQIKDMFGGVGNAVKVVSAEVLKLATNPWILLAAAIAAVGAAALSASNEVTELAVATAKGSQVAGQARQLAAVSDALSGGNTSHGNAVSATAQLAAAGKLTGENFIKAAQAASQWATVTGESVDEVVGKFNELANDPLQAVLNGTLKVTDAQYAQLEALDRTGQKQAEVALAVKLYQDQVNDNTASVLANLSEGEKGWIKLKDAISDAIHELGVFAKNAAGKTFQVFSTPVHVVGMDEQGGLIWEADAVAAEDAAKRTQAAAATIAAAQAQGIKLTPMQVKANDDLQKSYDALGTKAQRFSTELKKLQATLRDASPQKLSDLGIEKAGDSFSGAGFDKLVNGLRLKIFGQNQGGDPTRPIKEWEKTALDSLKNVQQATDYAYADKTETIETYYDVSRGLIAGEENIQLQSIDKQIAALKGRDNSEAQIAQLQQQRATIAEQYAEKKAKLDREELLSIRQREDEYRNYTQQLADANIQLARQGDQAVRGVGMGARQAGLANAVSDAQFNESQQERNIQQRADNHQIDQAQADKEKAAAAAALSTQLDLLQNNYKNLSDAESSWLNGSTKAWQEWLDDVNNVAKQSQQLVSTTLTDLQDMFLQLVQTGHLSITKLLTDVVTQIEKSGIQYALKQALQWAQGAANGGSSASGDYGTNFGGLLTSIGSLLFSAKGNTFGAGTGLTAYRNSIVSSPTIFPFAKGGVPNVGVMGEKAGSPGEAIMPLTRTASGELAVKSTGNGNGRPNPNIYQTFVVPGAVNRQTQDQIAQRTYGAATRAVRRNT